MTHSPLSRKANRMNSDMEKDMTNARIAGISRLRMETDGPGIRTLVHLSGCRLDCAYCLNGNLRSGRVGTLHEPEALLDRVRKDDIYFRASGGGITFGGGEPLLHSRFIREFKQMCPPEWTITVETSLNVPKEDLERLLDAVDLWIVDIKDLDPGRYLEYTGESNEHVLENLDLLRERCVPAKVRVRVPWIGGLNTPEDVNGSAEAIRAMGFETEVFKYVIPDHLLKEASGEECLTGDLLTTGDEAEAMSKRSPWNEIVWKRFCQEMERLSLLGFYDEMEHDDDWED